jgi:hypothetical protein
MFGSLSYRTRSVELIMRLQRLIVPSFLPPILHGNLSIPTITVFGQGGLQ